MDRLDHWELNLIKRLSAIGSTERSLIWKEKRTPAGRSVFQLAPWTPPTSGSGSIGSPWSTPRASDGEKGGPNMSFGAGGQPLPAQMHQAMWVTASSRDWKDTPGMATEAGDRKRIDQLPRQMAQEPQGRWGTVAAHPPGGTPEQFLARKEKARENGASIGISLTDCGLQMIATAYMPTPTVADVQGGRKARSGKRSSEPLLNGICYGMDQLGPTPNGSSATTEKRGAPNPVFAFWLMGFPEEWTSGALAAMQSFRSSRRKLSAHSSTQKKI